MNPENSLLLAGKVASFGKYAILTIVLTSLFLVIRKKQKSQSIKPVVLFAGITILLVTLVIAISSYLLVLPAYNLN